MSRILVVAEAEPARDALVAGIRSAPHTVKAVSPGQLELEQCREWDPDIIVMDLSTDSGSLPLRIGMLRDPQLAQVPFVAVGDNEDEARALGAHAFVRLPVAMKHLLTLLARLAAMTFPLPA